jgi:hypothetical protein
VSKRVYLTENILRFEERFLSPPCRSVESGEGSRFSPSLGCLGLWPTLDGFTEG